MFYSASEYDQNINDMESVRTECCSKMVYVDIFGGSYNDPVNCLHYLPLFYVVIA